jgi:hypothetical protein
LGIEGVPNDRIRLPKNGTPEEVVTVEIAPVEVIDAIDAGNLIERFLHASCWRECRERGFIRRCRRSGDLRLTEGET